MEPIIQSEVSQKERHQIYSHTHTHIYIYMEFRKMVMNMRDSKRDTDKKNRLLDSMEQARVDGLREKP